jgi:hypothetical protein
MSEEFEHCRIGVAMTQIGLDHVDLIKIGQQRAGRASMMWVFAVVVQERCGAILLIRPA